jgi:hypothetical protein
MRSCIWLIFLGTMLMGLQSTTVYARDKGGNWWSGGPDKGNWHGQGHGHGHGHGHGRDCEVPEIGATGLSSALFVVLGAAAIVASQRQRRRSI